MKKETVSTRAFKSLFSFFAHRGRGGGRGRREGGDIRVSFKERELENVNTQGQ